MDKDVYIFDIDGTIVKDIFSNLNTFVPVDEARKLMAEQTISNNFVTFFNKIAHNHIYFVTGRQHKFYGDITHNLLKKINIDNNIIFFPDTKQITVENYIKFKINSIKKIIKNHKNQWIIIFDDKPLYFKPLYKKIQKINNKISFVYVPHWDNFWKQYL